MNMRFIACLSLKLAEGAEPGQAVNNLIRSFVEELIAKDVPTEISTAFAKQYTANRAEILAAAAKWTERMHTND